jgi:hypothetical protein
MKKPLNEYVNLLPYPKDALTRFSFVVGDVIALGVIALIIFAVFQNFVR